MGMHSEVLWETCVISHISHCFPQNQNLTQNSIIEHYSQTIFHDKVNRTGEIYIE